MYRSLAFATLLALGGPAQAFAAIADSVMEFGPPPKSEQPVPTEGPARKAYKREMNLALETCSLKTFVSTGFERDAVAACDTALSFQPEKYSWAWRRNQLLLFRALHMIRAGAPNGALAILDQADAEGKALNDDLYDGSTGTGNAMLRAYALAKTDRKTEALAVIETIRARRPYAVRFVSAFDQLDMFARNDLDHAVKQVESRTRLQPGLFLGLFHIYLERGQLSEAGKVADEISLRRPKLMSGWTIKGDPDEFEQLEEDATLQAERAYVFSALGQEEKARKIMGDANRTVDAFAGKPPEPRDGGRVSKSAMEAYQRRVQAAADASALLTRFSRAIQLRAELRKRPGEEMIEEIIKADVSKLSIFSDFVRNVRFKDAEAARLNADKIKAIDLNLNAGMSDISEHELGEMLPTPEPLYNVPRYKKAGDGFWLPGDAGYSVAQEKGSDFATVRYGTTSGSAATTEELVLLGVAELAQSQGKDSFVLTSRMTMSRTQTVSSIYSSYTLNDGYESLVRTTLLDSKNLPADWPGVKDRLIFVKDIFDTIKARYDSLEARKAAEKGKK